MFYFVRLSACLALFASCASPATAACLEISATGTHEITGETGFDCLRFSYGTGEPGIFNIRDGAYQSLKLQDVEAHLYGGTIGGLPAGSFTQSSIYMRGGSLAVHSGTILPNAETFSIEIDREAQSTVYLHGFGFQIDPYPAGGFITQARGYLADRSYVELTISRVSDEPLEWYPIVAVAEPFPFDPDDNGSFSITDLNLVRNNYGGSEGDLNGDGFVGMFELATVHNLFGASVVEFHAVPEPPSFWLYFWIVVIFYLITSNRRRR